jgi:glycosyltransferase involved in cell wall biosynthesis
LKADNQKKPVIHFWVPYPESTAPSQRFRVELFLPTLTQKGFQFEVLSFLDEKAWEILYKPGKGFMKTIGTIKGFFRRIIHLWKSVKADYIFLHREATPVGPPVFEWLLVKILRKKIIHEYDDAIWIPGGEKISWIKKWLKATWKVKYIIRWAYKIAAGNEFLCNYARQYNSSVFLIPTVVDTQNGHNKMRDQFADKRIVVGWTGTHTTLHNLEEIQDIIPELKKEIDFDFYIISNKPPEWNFDFIYKQWDEETEVDDLLRMHIGVMPLKKGPWFEGKCGFKLIQYHALGIPAVASPVGVNSLITLNDKTGFIANTPGEWRSALKKLIEDAGLRSQMGQAGKEHIESNYSLNSLLPAFISLFS